jgi:hypothetical protein
MPTGYCRSAAPEPGGLVAGPGGNHGLVVAWTNATMTLPVSMSFHPIATAPELLSVAASGSTVPAAVPPKRTSGVPGLTPTW